MTHIPLALTWFWGQTSCTSKALFRPSLRQPNFLWHFVQRALADFCWVTFHGQTATMHLQSLKPINTICCLLKSLDLQSNSVVAHMKDGSMKYQWSVRADCRFKWKTSPKPEVNGSGQNCVRCYLVKSQDCIHTCSRIITPLKWGFDNCKHFWMIITWTVKCSFNMKVFERQMLRDRRTMCQFLCEVAGFFF